MSRIAPVLLLSVCVFASACSHSGAYREADAQSWLEFCPPHHEEAHELRFWDDCAMRARTLGAHAACDAGDDLGCAVAALEYIDDDSELHDVSLAIDLGEDGCSRGDKTACIGQATAMGQGTQKQINAAYSLLRKLCREDVAEACQRLGGWYEYHAEKKDERRLAAGLYKRSCDLEHGPGCRDFARVYEKGLGVPKSDKRAHDLRERACVLGDKFACKKVGKHVEETIDNDKWHTNLSISYRDWVALHFEACESGFRHACTYIGRTLHSKATVAEPDDWYVEREIAAYRLGCRLGSPENCYFLAKVYRKGRGEVEADAQKAVATAAKACQGGLVDGCERYWLYLSETIDRAGALDYANKCNGGDADACYVSGRAFVVGESIEAEVDRGRALLEKGCSAGSALSCERLAITYCNSDDPKGAELAGKYFERACSKGAEYSCYALGDLYDEGEGVGADESRAIEYWVEACHRGWGKGCAKAGYRLRQVESRLHDKRARSVLAIGCEYGNTWACVNYAHMNRSGSGGEKDLSEARFHFRKACHEDFGAACYFYAKMLEDEDEAPDGIAEPVEAVKYYEMGCEGGYGSSCAVIGVWYRRGENVEKDCQKALEFARRGCEGDSAWACSQLGTALLTGRGTERDPKRARKVLKKACELTDSKGWVCANYAHALREGIGGPKDIDKAYKLAKSGCEADIGPTCGQAALMLRREEVEASSEREAGMIFSKVCELGSARWCRLASLNFRFGRKGVAKNLERADRFLDRAIEMERKACVEGDSQWSCYIAAHMIAHYRGTDTDFPGARTFLNEACDAGVQNACAVIARERVSGELFPRNPQKAEAGLAKSCKDNKNSDCRLLALYHLRGDGDPAPAKAAKIYEKVCHPKERPDECIWLGSLYARGDGVKRNAGTALRLLRTYCKKNDDDSICSKALGSMFYLRRKELGEFDVYEDAKRRCENEEEAGVACLMQARALQHGFGVERDVEAAKLLYTKVCTSGDPRACSRLGALAKKEQFEADSPDMEAKAACEKGDKVGCLAAAVAVEFGSYEPGRFAKAGDLYAKACALRDADACTLYAATGRDSSGLLTGKRYWNALVSSCDLGTAKQCKDAGEIIDAYNWSLGIEQYKKACQKGDEDACRHLETNGYERPASSKAATN
ncbi:sel1 repeat family protein [Persicimonas caeni]|uniref:Sel1 repeat family protein n=1 Tax=Persicimonas caeni TaxID=2292766 RepID=A0A4Y6Q329_PERCE|nr:SEL1-like repeat protein [Persicimonas caeni]QDG54577.1 sel1 repeat family protein [Persicimonas caeni]QED35798.1 sel1 repeat family protein [Persicimonas caeni]